MRGLRQAVAMAVVLLVAGCARPASRDDASDAAIGLPSSLDVDLHESVLNITMPEGQPTMLVALNVTKDMWVRPWVSVGNQRYPVQSTDQWLLCPWVRSFGIPAGSHFFVVAFWIEGTELQVTMEQIQGVADGDDSTGAGCRGWTRGATARDGTLGLLVTAYDDATTFPREPISPPSPRLSFLVGVGQHPCSDDPASYDVGPPPSNGYTELCPPEEEVVADPSLRGGEPILARVEGTTGADCSACGFEIRDERVQAGPAPGKGKVSFARSGELVRGLTFGRAGTGAGESNVALVLTADGVPTTAACSDGNMMGNQIVNVLAPHAVGASMVATYETTGPSVFDVSMLEIPIDISERGWTLKPTVVQRVSGAAYGSGIGPNLCD